MSDNFTKIHDGCSLLISEANYLDSIADCCYMTGKDKMGKKLNGISTDIRIAELKIKKAVGDETYRQFQLAEQSSVNVVNGVLAGIKMIDKPK